MNLGLKGLNALVTGSARGLGYAAAKVLAEEGANVCLNARNHEALQNSTRRLREETNQTIVFASGDVSNRETCDQIVSSCAAQLGGIDILITNCGGPPPGPFESHSDETWQRAVELSFFSHVWLIRAALPYLRNSRAASVLTVTSYSVKQPIPNLILSNSVRSATIGLTKTLALEMGTEGIRFNSILPGWTLTERVEELLSARAQANGTSVEDELRKQTAESPLGRLATPDEFARVCAFLVSPAASYLTGVMLPLDGGMYKGTM